MEKKKTLNRLFKTLFSICLIAILIVGGYFIFRPTEEDYTEPSGPSRYFLAQTAIFNEEFSQNYTGIYKFDRITFINLSHLSTDSITNIFNYYKVDTTLNLKTKLNTQKKNNSKNETLIIENGRFQFNKNKNAYLIGEILGNDDFSIMQSFSNKQLFTASLTPFSQSELENLTTSDEIKYNGAELYLTEKFSIVIKKTTYEFDVVYVYKIQNSQ